MRNCFISYHHDYDQEYLEELRSYYSGQNLLDYSLKQDIGHLSDTTIYKHIRQKISKTSVSIVLIGERTGDRWWIDWEIYASLRTTQSSTPNGLLGIYLPENKVIVPERLQLNIESGYAVTMDWDGITPSKLERSISIAYSNRRNKSHLRIVGGARMDSNQKRFLGIKI